MRNLRILLAATLFSGAAMTLPASIIFDDFNVNEGHFNLQPTFSGTTQGILTTSTADRLTEPSPLEGDGFERLVLNVNGTTTSRVRFLSGSGTVANNTPFTTTAGEDGWIGFYLRTSDPGWTVNLNLDGAGGTAAEMDMSANMSIIADGTWRLYEWDLDAVTGWQAVAGIGGGHGGALVNGSHTIDSIYFRALANVTGTFTFDLDFVAKSDSGSIATLVPEPSSVVLAVLGGGMLLVLLRRRIA